MEIPTNMHLLTFLAACVLFTTTECATSFQECPATVDSDTVGILICENYTAAEITWEFTSGQGASLTIGLCTNSSTCTPDPAYSNLFTLTPITGTSSQLTLTTTFTAGNKSVTFVCDGVNCVVNILEPTTTTMMPTTVTETTTEATTEVVTTGTEKSSSSSPVVTTGTEESSSSSPEAPGKEGLTGEQTAGIVIGVIGGVIVIGVIIGGIVRYNKKKKPGTETNGNETGNATPLNDTVPNKPANPNGTESETTGNGTGNTTSSNASASEKPAIATDGQP